MKVKVITDSGSGLTKEQAEYIGVSIGNLPTIKELSLAIALSKILLSLFSSIAIKLFSSKFSIKYTSFVKNYYYLVRIKIIFLYV